MFAALTTTYPGIQGWGGLIVAAIIATVPVLGYLGIYIHAKLNGWMEK